MTESKIADHLFQKYHTIRLDDATTHKIWEVYRSGTRGRDRKSHCPCDFRLLSRIFKVEADHSNCRPSGAAIQQRTSSTYVFHSAPPVSFFIRFPSYRTSTRRFTLQTPPFGRPVYSPSTPTLSYLFLFSQFCNFTLFDQVHQ